jgi:hypothetical protein
MCIFGSFESDITSSYFVSFIDVTLGLQVGLGQNLSNIFCYLRIVLCLGEGGGIELTMTNNRNIL